MGPDAGAAGSTRSGPAGGPGTHRRAEVAAAGAALVLHHPAPVVFTQHQEGRLAGRAHELVLDHAVGAPAQLQADQTAVRGRGRGGGPADPQQLRGAENAKPERTA